MLERAAAEPIRVVVAAPPQHGKTETTIHAYPWWFRKIPGRRHAYATYAHARTERVSDKARLIAQRDGVELHWRKDFWYEPASGSSIVWTSIGGPLTGEPIDGVLVVDDPIKERHDAESALKRQRLLDWLDDVALPRCHKTASVVVMATRWHPEDLSGLCIKRGWQYVNLKAIAEGDIDAEGRVVDDPLHRLAGEALCEALHTKASIEEKRRTNVYSFVSLYQGEPRPRGGALFSEPTYYSTLPEHSFRVSYGVDLAYTAKTHADFSVCIEVWREETQDPKKPRFYIVDVQRKQVDAPSFTLTLKAKHSQRPAKFRWYAGGTEKGSGDFIKRQGIPLEVLPPKGDKFVRAQPVAAAWNEGRVMVPDEAPWLPTFLDEVLNFTGVNDVHDDCVDALAAGFDALAAGPSGSIIRVKSQWS